MTADADSLICGKMIRKRISMLAFGTGEIAITKGGFGNQLEPKGADGVKNWKRSIT